MLPRQKSRSLAVVKCRYKLEAVAALLLLKLSELLQCYWDMREAAELSCAAISQMVCMAWKRLCVMRKCAVLTAVAQAPYEKLAELCLVIRLLAGLRCLVPLCLLRCIRIRMETFALTPPWTHCAGRLPPRAVRHAMLLEKRFTESCWDIVKLFNHWLGVRILLALRRVHTETACTPVPALRSSYGHTSPPLSI